MENSIVGARATAFRQCYVWTVEVLLQISWQLSLNRKCAHIVADMDKGAAHRGDAPFLVCLRQVRSFRDDCISFFLRIHMLGTGMLICVQPELLGWFLIITRVAQIAEGATQASHLTLLGVTALLCGVTLPVYTLAISLAFARTDGQTPVKVATTLLLAHSSGAVADPMIVAILLPTFGLTALMWVIVSTSALMTGFALEIRTARGAHGPSATPKVEIPATSVVLTESIAEVPTKATAATAETDCRPIR